MLNLNRFIMFWRSEDRYNVTMEWSRPVLQEGYVKGRDRFSNDYSELLFKITPTKNISETTKEFIKEIKKNGPRYIQDALALVSYLDIEYGEKFYITPFGTKYYTLHNPIGLHCEDVMGVIEGIDIDNDKHIDDYNDIQRKITFDWYPDLYDNISKSLKRVKEFLHDLIQDQVVDYDDRKYLEDLLGETWIEMGRRSRECQDLIDKDYRTYGDFGFDYKFIGDLGNGQSWVGIQGPDDRYICASQVKQQSLASLICKWHSQHCRSVQNNITPHQKSDILQFEQAVARSLFAILREYTWRDNWDY